MTLRNKHMLYRFETSLECCNNNYFALLNTQIRRSISRQIICLFTMPTKTNNAYHIKLEKQQIVFLLWDHYWYLKFSINFSIFTSRLATLIRSRWLFGHVIPKPDQTFLVLVSNMEIVSPNIKFSTINTAIRSVNFLCSFFNLPK